MTKSFGEIGKTTVLALASAGGMIGTDPTRDAPASTWTPPLREVESLCLRMYQGRGEKIVDLRRAKSVEPVDVSGAPQVQPFSLRGSRSRGSRSWSWSCTRPVWAWGWCYSKLGRYFSCAAAKVPSIEIEDAPEATGVLQALRQKLGLTTQAPVHDVSEFYAGSGRQKSGQAFNDPRILSKQQCDTERHIRIRRTVDSSKTMTCDPDGGLTDVYRILAILPVQDRLHNMAFRLRDGAGEPLPDLHRLQHFFDGACGDESVDRCEMDVLFMSRDEFCSVLANFHGQEHSNYQLLFTGWHGRKPTDLQRGDSGGVFPPDYDEHDAEVTAFMRGLNRVFPKTTRSHPFSSSSCSRGDDNEGVRDGDLHHHTKQLCSWYFSSCFAGSTLLRILQLEGVGEVCPNIRLLTDATDEELAAGATTVIKRKRTINALTAP